MAQSERMGPKGDVLPTTCKIGDSFMLISRSGSLCTFHMCFTDNTWTAVAGNDITLNPTISVG